MLYGLRHVWTLVCRAPCVSESRVMLVLMRARSLTIFNGRKKNKTTHKTTQHRQIDKDDDDASQQHHTTNNTIHAQQKLIYINVHTSYFCFVIAPHTKPHLHTWNLYDLQDTFAHTKCTRTRQPQTQQKNTYQTPRRISFIQKPLHTTATER